MVDISVTTVDGIKYSYKRFNSNSNTLVAIFVHYEQQFLYYNTFFSNNEEKIYTPKPTPPPFFPFPSSLLFSCNQILAEDIRFSGFLITGFVLHVYVLSLPLTSSPFFSFLFFLQAIYRKFNSTFSYLQ